MFKYLVVYKAEPLHMDFSTDGGHLKAGTLLLPAINSLLTVLELMQWPSVPSKPSTYNLWP